MLETFTEFADYVWDFYSPKSDLYPIKGLTIEDVFQAIYTYKQRLLKVIISVKKSYYMRHFGLILLDNDLCVLVSCILTNNLGGFCSIHSHFTTSLLFLL